MKGFIFRCNESVDYGIMKYSNYTIKVRVNPSVYYCNPPFNMCVARAHNFYCIILWRWSIYYMIYMQVCTADGWRSLAFSSDICAKPSVAKRNLDTFKKTRFGILLQFNSDLRIDFSPMTNANIRNISTGK